MVKRIFAVLAATAAFAAMLCVFGFSAGDEPRVFDYANLFTDEEKQSLANDIAKFKEKTGYDFVVVTQKNLGGRTSQGYADDFYDYPEMSGYSFGTDTAHSGMLYLIDMENRLQTISTTGEMIEKITDSELEMIFDAAASPLHSGDYADAAHNAIRQSKNCTVGEGLTIIEAAVALVAGLATAFFIKRAVSNDYELKGSVYSYNYKGNSKVLLTTKRDTFEYESVVRRPKSPPPTSGGGGGSSVHMGSSGTSHGGGSRGF